MFSYAEAETLLARLHGANEEVQKGAFRGRLKHLKRLGVPLNSSPGRGQKVKYDIQHICQWSFCLELEQIGLDPSLIVSIVKLNWDWIFRDGYRDGLLDGNQDWFFYFEPAFMTSAWGGETGGAFNQLGAIGAGPLKEVTSKIAEGVYGGRLCIIDIGSLGRRILTEADVIKNNWA